MKHVKHILHKEKVGGRGGVLGQIRPRFAPTGARGRPLLRPRSRAPKPALRRRPSGPRAATGHAPGADGRAQRLPEAAPALPSARLQDGGRPAAASPPRPRARAARSRRPSPRELHPGGGQSGRLRLFPAIVRSGGRGPARAARPSVASSPSAAAGSRGAGRPGGPAWEGAGGRASSGRAPDEEPRSRTPVGAMPCGEDWLSQPLGIVQGFFAQNGVSSDWEKKVVEYFKEKLKESNAPKWVPSLNEVPLHYLKPNSFVKFRCMIQDMFDPEFYMGVYETVNQNTKARVLHFGKYRDVAECGPQQEVDLNSPRTTTLERQTFYCVPVPGESSWVKEAYVNTNQARVSPSTSYTPSRHKRSYEDDEDMDHHPHKQKDQHAGAGQAGNIGGLQWCGEPKRLETEASAGQQLNSLNLSSPFDLNFPLPGEKGPACLVKVYEDWDCFKVNDVLELYGILSVDPVLSILNNDERDASSVLDPMECSDTAEEQRVRSPPASLVPRIHVVLAQKLQHINPLLPACLKQEESKACKFVSSFMSELSPVRAELLGFLTHALLGDSLAAEYLILHLISTVYTRRDVLPLGKFTVNLSGCPRNSTYTEHLYRIIQHLVPASFRLQMTIENMNQLKLIPHKDYTANRLVSGLLQLPSNTSLVIDETLLEQGQLDTSGVHNVTALSNLITWQKVDYDFSYHQMEFPCNINVLITSEGRSLLPADCQIHLQPQLIPPNMEEYMDSLLSTVLPSVLNKFRIYLTLLRLLDYSISDEVTKAVEDDFVEMRKNDPQSITADDLHQLLIVARFLSLSAGQTTLSRERWLRAKQLESLRRTRLQQQKCVNGNEL